ncbi:MAG TPA: acyl-CoA dehydrogenase family protein [Gemmatimonadaceae bacterium]|nr:acyl-CoA dehydrogenase family protein [Gemmatimonadaceae bacterium]
MTEFFQGGPQLGNQYDDDSLLQAYLRWRLPSAMRDEIEPGLRRLGARAATDILALGDAAEADPPRHVPFDAWGQRVDRIETSPAWQALDRISAEEGLVAIGYERRHGALSRIDQFARLYLFSPSSATYSCPLAMTDGAARCLELYGGAELTERMLPHLTSRDPARFWTSGQWMTERTGGSDVSLTSTIAARDGRGYRLHGTKWFTSATTAQVALTLARIEGAPSGSKGLSLFAIELRDADGMLRNIRVHRLKEKLGTRALPTAELSLEGTPAILVGEPGDGVRKIAALLNITRLYNACAAVAGMRRAIALARDYARRRNAFGKRLIDHPLHVRTLARLEVECEAGFHLVFRAIELLGKEEVGEATPSESAQLRLLTPVVKLYTGKQAVAVASEAIEAFGGVGYIEDSGLPRLLRDAQVLSIWEGTTNVLSLDVLRAMERADALEPLLADSCARLDRAKGQELAESVTRTRSAVERLRLLVRRSASASSDEREAGARSLSYGIARTAAAGLLLEHAAWRAQTDGDRRSGIVARRWCAGELLPPIDVGEAGRAEDRLLMGPDSR